MCFLCVKATCRVGGWREYFSPSLKAVVNSVTAFYQNKTYQTEKGNYVIWYSNFLDHMLTSLKLEELSFQLLLIFTQLVIIHNEPTKEEKDIFIVLMSVVENVLIILLLLTDTSCMVTAVAASECLGIDHKGIISILLYHVY